MMSEISHVYIMNATGVVLIDYGKEEPMDPMLFTGFLSAVNTIAMQMDGCGLNCVEMGNKTISIVPASENILVVGIHSRKIKRKKIQSILKEIATAFLTKFAYQLEQLGPHVNTRIFQPFVNTIAQVA